MIVYNKGNLLVHSTDKIIVHGVNCLGVMGAGVALSLKLKYPELEPNYKAYCKTWEGDSPNLLGEVFPFLANDGILILNMFTQAKVSSHGDKMVSYDALYDGFIKVSEFCVNNDVSSISIPKIGAGLGGGRWSIIEKIIEETVDPSITVNVWVL